MIMNIRQRQAKKQGWCHERARKKGMPTPELRPFGESTSHCSLYGSFERWIRKSPAKGWAFECGSLDRT
ncbi:hypothetical protein AERO9A_250302 [Aeromonas salmonicida]|nr:hypothetical protein AERO9A_250302 [Aeromonas salmonicida]